MGSRLGRSYAQSAVGIVALLAALSGCSLSHPPDNRQGNQLVKSVPAATVQSEVQALPFDLIAHAAQLSAQTYRSVQGAPNPAHPRHMTLDPKNDLASTYGANFLISYYPFGSRDKTKIEEGTSYDFVALLKPKHPCLSFAGGNWMQWNWNQVQIVAFRGTDSVPDVLNDIHIDPVGGVGLDVRVHKGFFTAANDAYRDLKSDLDPNCPTLFTGHSKGGASALVAYLVYTRVEHHDVRQGAVITFGQPLATFPLQGSEGDQVLRVIHARDPVPAVPPPEFGYRHTGSAIYLWDDHTWSYMPRRLAEQEVWTLEWASPLIAHGEDHGVANYEALAAALSPSTLVDYAVDKRFK